MYRSQNSGFTLVEMLVSISIASLIMTTVFFNYRTFTDDLALSAAAQEMAIAVRQTQSYGLTVKEVTIGGGQFSSAYGIYFDLNQPSNYYLFADTNTTGNARYRYDVGSGCGSGSTECIEKFNLNNGVQITSICDANACPPASGVEMMNISFLRPIPDASIYFYTNSAGASVVGPSGKGKIKLTSPRGSTMTITVDSTGQVLVQKP